MAELILVHDPVKAIGKPRLVFIHGLDGDIRTTWMANPKDPKTLWPEWVGQETGCPIWLLGYGAAMSGWRADAMALPRQATAILERLSNESRLLGGPLILVGHSLGGLIIKTVIQHAMSRNVERHKAVAKNVKGIVFVGTPHFGSRLASIAAWCHLMRSNPQVRDLGLDDAHLETLNQYFLAQRQELGFRTRIFYETEPVRIPVLGRFLPGITIVSPTSSDAHIPSEVGIPIEANHISICKPIDRNAAIHRSLVAFVDEVKSAESVQSAEATRLGSGVLDSDEFQAMDPGARSSISVHLAFTTYGVSLKGTSDSPVSTSVCLVTDEPDRIRSQLFEIRSKIRRDPLIPEASKHTVDTVSLRELALNPATQSILLRELAVMSFSVYLYYAEQDDFCKLSTQQRERQFIIEPLVHRLSKKGEIFEQVHSRFGGVNDYLKSAGVEIEKKFHRRVELPTLGATKYSVLEELACFIAWASAAHLCDPSDIQAASIFESLRTRIRFGQNVVTGQRHKRDVDPLP